MFVVRLFICAASAVALIAQAADPQATFERAVTLVESKKYAEAIPLLQDILTTFPESQGALWNLGIAAVEVGDQAMALETWSRYRMSAPDDWRVIPKLIQTYQSLGRFSDRDRERDTLLAFRRSLTAEEIAKFAYYCREQFSAGEAKIMAFEFFEPQGPRRVFYRFSVVDDAGLERFYFSLGSYDSTTQIARELGEITAGDRAYHLDKYQGTSHSTYAHFNSLPPYDTIRTIVVAAMSGKTRSLSESKR